MRTPYFYRFRESCRITGMQLFLNWQNGTALKSKEAKKTSLDGVGLRSLVAPNQGRPLHALERSLPSEVRAISPFVEAVMLLFRQCGCVPQSDSDVETHCAKPSQTRSFTEIMEIPENTSMFVAAVTRELSIAAKDEGRGFDIDRWRIRLPRKTGSDHGVDLPDESADG